MVQKTPQLAAAVSSSGAPGCLKQFIVLEKGNVVGTLTGLMIAGAGRVGDEYCSKGTRTYPN